MIASEPQSSVKELDLSQSAISCLGLEWAHEASEPLVAVRLPANFETLHSMIECEGAHFPSWLRTLADDPPGCLRRLRTIACANIMPNGWAGVELCELGQPSVCFSVEAGLVGSQGHVAVQTHARIIVVSQ